MSEQDKKPERPGLQHFAGDCKLEAVCTWGDGPDILINNDGFPYMLYEDPSMKERAKHGFSFKGSFDLNLVQAKQLFASLGTAIRQVEELEQTAKDHDDLEKSVIDGGELEDVRGT